MLRIGILILALFCGLNSCFSSNLSLAARASENTLTDSLTQLRTTRSKQFTDTTRLSAYQRSQRLYDSIKIKSNRRVVPRFFYNLFFIRPRISPTPDGAPLDESRILEPYAGKIIDNITIERQQVFNPNGSWLERAGNKTHALTRDRVIRRDLLMRQGDILDPGLIIRNKQLLRTRSYISDAEILVIPDSLDTTRVNLVIRTRDSWTISADGALRSDNRVMVAASDANIFGTGNMLKIETNFNRRNFTYGGNIIRYKIPNFLGTFFAAEISAGREFYNDELKVSLRKEFIRPTDYEVGMIYNNIKSRYYMIHLDTSQLARVRNVDTWFGKSKFIKPINSSIFLTGRYNYRRFIERSEIPVSEHLNPSFHGHDLMLFGAGFYREKFYTANMIYGFGIREYLATGYKTELVSGYSWGEFNEAMYAGINTKIGGFTRAGYLMGSAALGSYIDLVDGSWSRSSATVDIKWFSNLFLVRRNRIRQFLGFCYTQGWNRVEGSGEQIRFTDKNGLVSLREYVTGINRMVLNTETVVFAPFQPLGFRFAFFGFADFGLIGNSANPFQNNFYTTFGLGMRIKNERLIFSAIQIRLGIAFNKNGMVDSEYFRLTNSPRLDQYRYRPTRPELVGFE